MVDVAERMRRMKGDKLVRESHDWKMDSVSLSS